MLLDLYYTIHDYSMYLYLYLYLNDNVREVLLWSCWSPENVSYILFGALTIYALGIELITLWIAQLQLYRAAYNIHTLV